MSYSVSFIGKPEAIKRKLAYESNRLTGQSKEEFDTVRPALETLLDQNLNNGVVHLEVSAHASIAVATADTPAHKTYGNCTARLTTIVAQLAE